jgi:hypothetical protein
MIDTTGHLLHCHLRCCNLDWRIQANALVEYRSPTREPIGPEERRGVQGWDSFWIVGEPEIAPLPMHAIAFLETNLPLNPFFSDLERRCIV